MTSGCSVGLPFSRLREGSCFFNVFFISELSCFILFIYLDFFFCCSLSVEVLVSSASPSTLLPPRRPRTSPSLS